MGGETTNILQQRQTVLLQHRYKTGGPNFGSPKNFTSAGLFNRANKTGYVVFPNKFMDDRLLKTSLRENEPSAYPAKTGTFVAYWKQNTTLEKAASKKGFLDCVENGVLYYFKIPEKLNKEIPDLMQEKNSVFVAEQGFIYDGYDYLPTIQMKEDGKNQYMIEFVNESIVHLLRNFPVEGSNDNPASYFVDETFAIPVGEKADPNDPHTRRLIRDPDGYVGFITRIVPPSKSSDISALRTIVAGGVSYDHYGALALDQRDFEKPPEINLTNLATKAEKMVGAITRHIPPLHCISITNLMRVAKNGIQSLPTPELQELISKAKNANEMVKYIVSKEVYEAVENVLCTLNE